MMNQFTKNMKPSLSADRKPRRQSSPWFLRWILATAVIVLSVFSAVCARIYLRSETENLNRRSARLDILIQNEMCALENLKSQKEALCSRTNIRRKLTEHRLELRPRQPDQVAYLKRYRNAGGYTAAKETKTDSVKETYTYHSPR